MDSRSGRCSLDGAQTTCVPSTPSGVGGWGCFASSIAGFGHRVVASVMIERCLRLSTSPSPRLSCGFMVLRVYLSFLTWWVGRQHPILEHISRPETATAAQGKGTTSKVGRAASDMMSVSWLETPVGNPSLLPRSYQTSQSTSWPPLSLILGSSWFFKSDMLGDY